MDFHFSGDVQVFVKDEVANKQPHDQAKTKQLPSHEVLIDDVTEPKSSEAQLSATTHSAGEEDVGITMDRSDDDSARDPLMRSYWSDAIIFSF